ncbi:MAG: hypothetical protein HFJ41_05500 [Clostridia bacterium]|nr:hypothetical protein [Clostridia bacterium]
MKCQNCGENEANVKYTQIINGVKKQMSLCDKCAQNLGIDDMQFNMPINFSSFLGDVFDIYEDTLPEIIKPKTLICDRCNITYDEFLQTGKFGCEECYEVFKTKLDQILKNIHGANRHVGRIGNSMEGSEKSQIVDNYKNDKINEQNVKERKQQKSKLEELQERLKQEIKEERYEDAAKTRDEIKKIK